MVTEIWLLVWAHNARYRWCGIVVHTWNLYDFINQNHPNNLIKKYHLRKGGWEAGWKGKGIRQKKKKNDTDNNMVITRGKRGWGNRKGWRGINGGGRRLDLGRWTHKTTYRWCVAELYPWTLDNFIKYHHHNKIN